MSKAKTCIVCKKTSFEVPVTKFYHKENKFFICSQHIPILIHKPEELIGLLDGADEIQGA